MRPLIALLFFVILSVAAQAQDVLFFKDGHTMEVHVKKITGSLIYYAADPGAPQRYVYKSKVEKIVYERGREVIFKDPAKRKNGSSTANNNVLTLAPMNFIVMGTQLGIGIGLDYERYIGERHFISVKIPVYAGFGSNDGYYEVDRYQQPYDQSEYVYTAPGIRFHWLKPTSKIDFASGVSAIIGNVNQTTVYDGSGINSPNIDQQFLLTAITIDNDFTLFSKRKIAFGVHTAFGPVFGDYGNDGKWIVQVGIKLGRRF